MQPPLFDFFHDVPLKKRVTAYSDSRFLNNSASR
jgi:hypothetical protein